MKDTTEKEVLYPEIIDHRAAISPDRTFAFLPKGRQLEDGFFPLTYSALAKAIDATARWLDQEIQVPTNGSTQTIPYIGKNDFRYILLFHACLKSGRCFMTPLTFNTPDGLARLIEGCDTVLTCEGHHHAWEAVQAKIPGLRMVEVPEVAYFLQDTMAPTYPSLGNSAERWHSVSYKIQSSGTTGSPKTIEYQIKEVHHFMHLAKLNETADEDEKFAMPSLDEGAYVPTLMPLSWAAGLQVTALAPLAFNQVPIMLPPDAPQPVTAEYVLQALRLIPRGEKNAIFWIPSGLRQLALLPGGLDELKRYDWVAYAGAPLDDATGDAIAKVTRVQSYMGDTSVGPAPVLLNDPSDWKIRRVSPKLGHFFEQVGDDLYEICIRRLPDESRPAFTSNPSMEVYHSRDMWRAVKGRPGFYETVGRMDDFVKLSSMTKFNAIELEHRLERHPGITRALVAGDGRPRPFAIVDIRDAGSDQSSEEIVAEALAIANEKVWGEVQLRADLIVVTDAARPIRKTDKGSTDRRNTIAMYSEQIDERYRKAGLAE